MDYYEIWIETKDAGNFEFQAAGVNGLEKAKEAARDIADTFAGIAEAGALLNVRRAFLRDGKGKTVYEIRLDEDKY